MLFAFYGGGVGDEAESKPLFDSPSPHNSWHKFLTINCLANQTKDSD